MVNVVPPEKKFFKLKKLVYVMCFFFQNVFVFEEFVFLAIEIFVPVYDGYRKKNNKNLFKEYSLKTQSKNINLKKLLKLFFSKRN
jgi:hypothetical protein